MRHLTPKLPRLQSSRHHTATPGKTMPRQMGSIQGTHTCLVLQSHHRPARAQQQLPCLQADLRSRMALTSADWLHNCGRSGTSRLMLTWAA